MSRISAAILTMGLMLAPAVAQSHEGESGPLEQVLVESATTPAQHEALAKYYRGKAANERKKAEEHLAKK